MYVSVCERHLSLFCRPIRKPTLKTFYIFYILQNSWCCCALVIYCVIDILTGCNSGSCVSKRSADTWTEEKSCRTSRMLHSFSNFQSSYRLLPWVKKDIKKKKKTFSQFIITQSFWKRGWPGLSLRTGHRGFSLATVSITHRLLWQETKGK